MPTACKEVDPAAVFQAELTDLAISSLPPGRFFHELLSRAVRASRAVAGAAWGLNRQGLLAQLCEVGLTQAGLVQSPPAARFHVQLLLDVLHGGRSRVHRPRMGVEAPPAINSVLLITPLLQRGNCVGVLELFLPAEVSDEDAAEKLREFEQFSIAASRYLKGLSSPNAEAAVPSASQMLAFAGALHRHLSVKDVAMAAVNEGRLLWGCDRASVALLRGNAAEILAISGLDRVLRRSNLVRAMARFCDTVLYCGREVRYTGELENLPPQIERALVPFLAESGAVDLLAIPLHEPTPPSASGETPAEVDATFGVLLLESFGDERPVTTHSQLDDAVTHVGQALHNARLHEGELLSPLWRTLQRHARRVHRTSPRRKAVYTMLAAASLLGLMVLPVPYYVGAEGELVPRVRMGVFAADDGEIVDILVEGGERIKKGQVLLRMTNDGLTTEKLYARNQMMEKEQTLAALVAERGAGAATGGHAGAVRLEGRIAQTKIEIESLRQRLAAIEKRQARLEVRSPIAGTLATFQPQQQLLGRPVQRGDLLLEVMDESGPWHLELDVPAHRVGPVMAAQRERRQGRLPVRFSLATSPEHTNTGFVYRVATRMTPTAENAAVLRAEAAVDRRQVSPGTAGTKVFAQIHCGRRSLAYWLIGDVVDFVRRRIW